MPRRSPRRVAPVLLLALAVAAGCGDDAGGDAADATASTATTTSGGATTATTGADDATTTTAPLDGEVVVVDVVGGQPAGGVLTARIPLGEQVTLSITSDTPDEVHVHGYELTAEVGPGTPAEITFVADIPGQFEVELHDSGALLVELVVA